MLAESVEAGEPVPVASRWPHFLARAVTAMLVAVVIGQAALAGDFLNGRYNALMLHSIGARVTEVLALIQLIVMIALRRVGGPRALIPVAVATMAVVIAQSATGLFRLTNLHVPLGVLLILGIVQLALTVWRLPLPAPADSRPVTVAS